MDEKTLQVLKLIKLHSLIKNYLTSICYFAIISGLFVYIFYAIEKNHHAVKLVKQYKESRENFKIEKVMTNPRMELQYENGQIYHIKAKQAHHIDQEQVILYDVSATGNIGNVIAGKLEVSEQGDHLVFSENPVLVLKQIKNLNKKN